MPHSTMTQTTISAVSEGLKASAEAGIRFENARAYNQALDFTFQRTVHNVNTLGKSLKILEIGSFTGVVSLALKNLGHDVTASDMPFVLEDQGLKSLFVRHGIPTLSADLSKHPFPAPDSSFDLIVFNEVIEHLNFNPIPLLKEFHRILKEGGRVYCATPNLVAAKNRWLLLRGHSYINPVEHLKMNLEPGTGMSVGLHWREWAKMELIELYETCGLKLESHSFGLVIPNQSGFLRRHAVSLMYRIAPSLMPNQVAIFRKTSH